MLLDTSKYGTQSIVQGKISLIYQCQLHMGCWENALVSVAQPGQKCLFLAFNFAPGFKYYLESDVHDQFIMTSYSRIAGIYA